jgi:hypothetical protein
MTLTALVEGCTTQKRPGSAGDQPSARGSPGSEASAWCFVTSITARVTVWPELAHLLGFWADSIL